MDEAISASNLSKIFDHPSRWRFRAHIGGKSAVDNVSLAIHQGELFGLLGPNGAGKTTLVKMLCTLILPTSGQATVVGYSLAQPEKIRQKVGLVVSDERSFYWRLTGWQNMAFFASMVGLSGREADQRIRRVLNHVDMVADAGKSFRTYSTGMKQRLAIARSLLHQPTILFMDEPSRSLDPKATSRLHQQIRELNYQQRTTIFLITHDLSEAEKLCGRVAVMHHGQIKVSGRPSDLRRQLHYRTGYILSIAGLTAAVRPALQPIAPDFRTEPVAGLDESGFLLYFSAGESDGRLTAVLDCLRDNQIEIVICSSIHPRVTIRVFIYLLLGTLIFTLDLDGANYWAALVTLLLSIIAFASIGIIAAGIIMIVKRGEALTTLFGAFANLVGGIYYPVGIMPGWLQFIAKLIPVTYAVRAMRLSLLAGASWTEIAPDLAILLGFIIVLFPLSLFVFHSAVEQARQDGSLAHY